MAVDRKPRVSEEFIYKTAFQMLLYRTTIYATTNGRNLGVLTVSAFQGPGPMRPTRRMRSAPAPQGSFVPVSQMVPHFTFDVEATKKKEDSDAETRLKAISVADWNSDLT